MHKSDNNNNNNKDTSKMQYFSANAWLLMLVKSTVKYCKGNYMQHAKTVKRRHLGDISVMFLWPMGDYSHM